MTQIKTKIPAELEPAAVGGMVTDSKYVKDRVKNKTQEEVNADTEERVSTLEESVGTGGSVDERIAVEKNRAEQAEGVLDGKVATEKQRAEGVESGLNTRLQTVEQLAEISVGGGDIGIGTAADFESDDPEDLAKVPTVGAMLGGANDGVYDISARHSGTKYADLAAALGTDGANVPVGVRKGGMSVKFVQSSDNKYVQFRCKTTSFSANPNDWYFEGDDTLIENPEYTKVWVDANNRIYMAFTNDGGIFFGAGVPKQFVKFLKNYVEKEEGKSLIDVDFANGISYIDNPEYSFVKLDENRRILYAVKKDGDFVFGCGVPSTITSLYGRLEENPEFVRVLIDKNKRIICGAGVDGKIKTYRNEKADIIRGSQIERIISLSNPIQILSSKDAEATQYDNGTIGFYNILQVGNLYYMYYLGVGHPYNGFSLLFAYSEDGINYTRGFPQGIEAPFTGNNGIIYDPSNRGSYTFVSLDGVLQVPDNEYPYRLIGEIGYNTYMWKSTDAIHWSAQKLIVPHLSDTQGACVLRGNIIKMYCRTWDGPLIDRQIGVVYFDIDGNIIAPPSTLFGHYYYTAAASPLDDRREILFPTHFDGRIKNGVKDQDEWLDCYIVDGTDIKQVDIDTSPFVENIDKSVYAMPRIITISGKQYLPVCLKDVYHDDEIGVYFSDSRYKLVEIEFLTKGMIRGNHGYN